MNRWMRKLHKWFGLVLALQFALWMASGLIMSLLDHDKVRGDHHRAEGARQTFVWPTGSLSPAAVLTMSSERPLRSIEASWLLDRPVYRLSDDASTWLMDAVTGVRVSVDSATALVVANADYVGRGRAGSPELLRATTLEVRGHSSPIWRVAFDDEDSTTIYVSGQDGKILARRNNRWRLFDIAWMLHIMGYMDRDDFNNPLLAAAAAGGLWIALTGGWLLVARLRMRKPAARQWNVGTSPSGHRDAA